MKAEILKIIEKLSLDNMDVGKFGDGYQQCLVDIEQQVKDRIMKVEIKGNGKYIIELATELKSDAKGVKEKISKRLERLGLEMIRRSSETPKESNTVSADQEYKENNNWISVEKMNKQELKQILEEFYIWSTSEEQEKEYLFDYERLSDDYVENEVIPLNKNNN